MAYQTNNPLLRFIGAALVFSALAALAPAQQQPAAADAEDAARKAIFASPEWRQAMTDFNNWLSVQQKYTPEQVAGIRSEFDRLVSTMTAAELRDYMELMKSKLAVLMSPRAQEARFFIADYISKSSPRRQAEIRAELPDFSTMTPAQMELALEKIMARIRGRKEKAAQQRTLQAERVQMNQQALAQSRASQERALNRAISSASRNNTRTPFVPQRPAAPTYAGSGSVPPYWFMFRW